MNSAVSVTDQNHPSDETLAAFVDNRLDSAARDEVIAHIADCADCRDTVLLATEMAAEEAVATEAPPNVVTPRFGARRIAPLVAIAAALVVVLGVPSIRERILGGSAMREVTTLAETMPKRPTDGRLSVDVSYKPAKPVNRNGGENPAPVAVDDIKAELAVANANKRASKSPSVENLHALGVARMFAGKHHEAVRALEQAVAKAQAPSAALLSDLAAACIAAGEYAKGLEAAERAWQIEQTPAAAWNRALALQRLFRDAESKAAWQEYLKIDPKSEWAQEAQRDFVSDL